MTQPLLAHGIRSVAVPLASCGEMGSELGDLHADIAATQQAIDRAAGPVVLCGHSYGGMVVTGAGADPHVTKLLYVTSAMSQVGQSLADVVGDEPTPWMDPSDDGTVGVHADSMRELFFQDCDEDATDGALARLTRQSTAPFGQSPPRIAWQEKPATYIVCTEDRAIPADVQRRRASPDARVIDFRAGHHPFLSQPEAFARLIADEIGAMCNQPRSRDS